jgi:hypothetical protein
MLNVMRNLKNQIDATNKANYGTFGNFAGGDQAFKFIMDRLQNGVDPKIRAMIEGQAGGQLRGGEQSINEAFAGSGSPIGAKLGALTSLRSNVGKNTQNTLLQADDNAKTGALQSLFGGAGLNADIGLKNRMQNFAEQQYRDSQGFDFGNFLGNLLNAGGNVFSSYILKNAKK